MIPIIVAVVAILGFAAASVFAAWWQRRRDAVAAFAAMADQLKRPSEMPDSRPSLNLIPIQLRGPGGRHAK